MNSHLLMVKMHKTIGAITCIPNNADQYLSFSVGQRKFLDIFQLMASSLEKLVNATHKADYQLTKNVFGSKTLNPIKKKVFTHLNTLSNPQTTNMLKAY